MQDAVLSMPDTLMVTFTLDPARDTPESLRKYAGERHASADRWLFLTGSEEEVERVITNGFLVPRSEKPGEPIIHGTQLVLVDRKGDMRVLYEGLKPEEESRILADIRRLLKE
jgi:protein SCO1/2